MPVFLTIAEVPLTNSILDAFVHLLGFVLVLVTLTFLWLATALMGKIVTRWGGTKPSADQAGKSDAPAELDPGVVAAISAAVYWVVGPNARVTAIESLDDREKGKNA